MFRITSNKGFHITFKNGYTVSVQFGPGNYCDNYDRSFNEEEAAGREGSSVAEIAVFGPDKNLIDHPMFGNNNVGGYMPPEKVLELMKWAEEQ